MGDILSATVKNLYQEIDYLNNISALSVDENLKSNIKHAIQFNEMMVKNNVHGEGNNVNVRTSVFTDKSVALFLYTDDVMKNSIIFENENEFTFIDMMNNNRDTNKSKYTILKEEDYSMHFKNIIEEL